MREFATRGRLELYPGDFETNSIQTGPGANEKRFSVGSAKTQVGRVIGNEDRAQMFAFWRHDPDATGTRGINISLEIDLHAVGISRRAWKWTGLIGGHVDDDFGMGDGVVTLDIESRDELF